MRRSNNDDGKRRSPAAAGALLADTFRCESARIVSALTRRVGAQHLDLVEDSVQDALVAAMRSWSVAGTPRHPGAWLTTAARNALLDRLRQQRFFAPLDALGQAPTEAQLSDATAGFHDERALADDQLRLLVYCCHPALSTAAQVALTLRLACALSVEEIARALYASPATIAQRIVRARRDLRAAQVEFALPGHAEFAAERLTGIQHAIYLLFDAGYFSAADAEAIRPLLVADALHLSDVLLRHPAGDTPRSRALAALLHLTAARLPARRAADGSLVRLEHQDRSRWSRELIARGFALLDSALTGSEVSRYHIEAAIAATHARAASFAAIDWAAIAGYDDQLMTLHPSPAVAIGRTIAIRYASGAARGMTALSDLGPSEQFENDLQYRAARAELLHALGERDAAIAELRKAAGLAGNPQVKRLFATREREWQTHGAN